jgi:ATP-dependent DNA helicase RecG
LVNEKGECQIKAVLFIKDKGTITNALYQKLNNIGKSVSTTDLQDLVEKRILVRVGKSGRGIGYILKM